MRRLAFLFIGIALLALSGCAAVERATGTNTLVISPEKWEQIRQEIRAKDCPAGKTAVAVAVESPNGGGTLTIRCQ